MSWAVWLHKVRTWVQSWLCHQLAVKSGTSQFIYFFSSVKQEDWTRYLLTSLAGLTVYITVMEFVTLLLFQEAKKKKIGFKDIEEKWYLSFTPLRITPCCQISDMVNWCYNIQCLSLAGISW